MSAGIEESEAFDAKKLPVMRTLARLHECDAEALYSRIDASELDVSEILMEMVSKNEVEASPRAMRGEKFALTSKGWAEYLKVLGTIYELSE
ncbi:MAG: hypothetical protein ACRD6W_08885 [Nitrososphaerales archaeon]